MGFMKIAVLAIGVGIVVQQLLTHLTPQLPQKGGGFAAPGWRKVADIFRSQLDAGLRKGSSFAVYYKGELVVEFWGGYADKEAKVAWDKHTVGLYCSTAKVTGAIVMAMLVERGLLDYEGLVKDYWPEFGQSGKELVTVKQLLSHQAGLAVVEQKFSIYDILNDPEKIGNILAQAKPNWTPGEAAGYHGVMMGLLMDQLVRRVDPRSRSLSQFFKEEIAEPYNVDFHIGLPRLETHRAARVYPVDLLSLKSLAAWDYWNIMLTYVFKPQSLFVRSMKNPPELDEDLENNPVYREVPTASSHGFGTGSSLAKLLGILVSQDSRIQKPLVQETVSSLAEPVFTGIDVVLLRNLSYGLGTVIRDSPVGSRLFGHFGAGGQIAFADLENELAWSHVTNYHSIYALGDDPLTLALEQAIYDCHTQVTSSREEKES